MDEDKVGRQVELYGAPVGELVATVTSAFGLSQSAVARVLGLSPAMLSQLVRGQRVKIGNPLVVSRLRSMLLLADEASDLTRSDLERRVEEIRRARPTLTTSEQPTPPSGPAQVHMLLTTVASGRELHLAVRALDDVAPGIAEVLRVYGTGAADEADRHWASIAHLMRG